MGSLFLLIAIASFFFSPKLGLICLAGWFIWSVDDYATMRSKMAFNEGVKRTTEYYKDNPDDLSNY